ncbi:alpha/beta hydrolase [Planctomicrobium piriforme]|uniref:Serine aminopeptidase S33 domain-containing protein n=1 Tax=Planctomicrobium piriforme TaxID=1576369 RepID=A0A1I3GNN1_9PLAN|nr:alpha/beta hydrolase [Planctomicrobium piriforme]SFI25077.1 hypothetical protein SAMN05421753_10770 [Planctomicrobium piriforme]
MHTESETTATRGSATRFWLRLLLLSFLLYMGVSLLFARLQRSMIYARMPGAVPVSAARLPEDRITELKIPAADGIALHGWLTRPEDRYRENDRKLVIVFPGNAGNRSYRIQILNDFNQLGCEALICDYRGYAENAGSPSEQALTNDAQAIFDYACRNLGYKPDQIILCGESLGGGVATRLAWDLCRAGTPPAGLILRATFTSLTDAAKRLYPFLPVRTILLDRYPSIDRIGEITCPILIIHGRRDTIVPFSQGERLFQAAPAASASGVPKTLLPLPNSDHNDLQMTAGREITTAHRRFVEQLRAAK